MSNDLYLGLIVGAQLEFAFERAASYLRSVDRHLLRAPVGAKMTFGANAHEHTCHHGCTTQEEADECGLCSDEELRYQIQTLTAAQELSTNLLVSANDRADLALARVAQLEAALNRFFSYARKGTTHTDPQHVVWHVPEWQYAELTEARLGKIIAARDAEIERLRAEVERTAQDGHISANDAIRAEARAEKAELDAHTLNPARASAARDTGGET